MTLSLLAAVFGFNNLHAQTVAYVVNGGNASNSVSVIDTATNTVTATIPVGHSPQGVAVAPDSAHAYVTNFSDGTVSVIDTATNTVVATVPLAAPGNPSEPFLPAITPDGKSLYVPDASANGVVVVNTATNTVNTTIPVGGSPYQVAIAPDGAHAYVARTGDGNVSVIDTATNTVVGSPIHVSAGGGEVFTVAVAPDGAHIYAGGGGNATVTIIATSNNATTTITGVPNATGLAITPDGASLYVTDGIQTVSVIDTATNAVQPSLVTVGNGPLLLAITPDGASVYVTNLGDGTVSVIATATNTVPATITVGSQPQGIAIANLSTPLAAFTVEDLDIGEHKVSLDGDLTLGANSGGLDLAHQPVTLTVGTLSFTIPAGSFKQVGGQHHFVCHTSNVFRGTISGLKVDFDLKAERGSSTAFDYSVTISHVDLDVPDPVTVTMKIGENAGTATACQDRDCD
ncbi:MAG TPA: YncE family protein [Candidatus Angelobacter sp.]